VGVYSGRQTTGETSYNPGTLDLDKTYYWRIDEVDETDPNSPWKGDVWSLTTVDYVVVLVVDDFESYNADENLIWYAWHDGLGYGKPGKPPYYEGNGTGSFVGHDTFQPDSPMEIQIVHGGAQSMPLYYDNDGTLGEGTHYETIGTLFYSEAERTWEMPQDWTFDNADTLTLYFRGEPDNDREPLFVAIEDDAGQVVVVTHMDTEAVLATEWQKWHIALADLQTDGVDVASVKKMIIGVGDRDNRQAGGTGLIYIDDIFVTNRKP
ncbi:MAG: hypothetical protein ACYS30_12885, partial [Planctomycetota bacterium]